MFLFDSRADCRFVFLTTDISPTIKKAKPSICRKEVVVVNEHKHFLTIRLTGPTIGSGRIPVSQLLRLLSQFNKVVFRVGRVLLGESDSVRKGRVQRSITDETALDLVEVTHGSPATVLGLERSLGQQVIESMDFGKEIIEKSLHGLKHIQTAAEELPPGFDAGVLLAWRDLGVMFEQGISEVTFRLNHRHQRLTTEYTERGFHRVQQRIQGPLLNIRTVEGRLLMADFKEHGTRCRIHPSAGEPIICLFSEAQKDEVLENILRFVRIVGEAKEDPITGKITSIVLQDIQRLENCEQERLDRLPHGTPLPSDFWVSPSLDALAEAQGTRPMDDVSSIFGTWPGDPDDGFEQIIIDLRKRNALEARLP